MSNCLWHLKSAGVFAQLAPEQLKRLESQSRSRAFPARNPIYLPAEKADSVFLLAEGLVKICHLTADGKESILAFVEPGELFGEVAIFDELGRDEYVEAVEPSTVVMIPLEEMRRLMADGSETALSITKFIGLRRQRIERRLKHLLFLSNRERLVHLLLDLTEQFGEEVEEGVRLRIKLSHQDLANLIGSTRETVTVILGHLKAEKLVAGGRRRIVLTDPQQLARGVRREMPRRIDRPTRRLAPLVARG